MRLKMVLPGVLLLAAVGACANGPVTNNEAGAPFLSPAPEPGFLSPPPMNEGGTPPSASGPTTDPGKLGKSVWTEPKKYSYKLTSSCGERAGLGKYQVTVQEGKIISAKGLDDSARRALMLRLAQVVPTLGQLEAEAETAGREGAEIKIERAADKHLTRLDIDRSPNVIDDEECYTIDDYTIGLTAGAKPTATR